MFEDFLEVNFTDALFQVDSCLDFGRDVESSLFSAANAW